MRRYLWEIAGHMAVAGNVFNGIFNGIFLCCLFSHEMFFGLLVVLGLTLRQYNEYFSLYQAISQRVGERGEKERRDESKNVQTTPPPPTYCKYSRPLPYCYLKCRTPRHLKFTRYHRTTRPPPPHEMSCMRSGT